MAIEPLKIRFFGRLADLLGGELDIRAPAGCSVEELRNRIAEEHPGAADVLRSGRVRACIDGVIVPDSHRIARGTEVEFLPPVSGG